MIARTLVVHQRKKKREKTNCPWYSVCTTHAMPLFRYWFLVGCRRHHKICSSSCMLLVISHLIFYRAAESVSLASYSLFLYFAFFFLSLSRSQSHIPAHARLCPPIAHQHFLTPFSSPLNMRKPKMPIIFCYTFQRNTGFETSEHKSTPQATNLVSVVVVVVVAHLPFDQSHSHFIFIAFQRRQRK